MILDTVIGVFIFLLALSGMQKGIITQLFNLLAFTGAVGIVILGDPVVSPVCPSSGFMTLFLTKLTLAIIFFATMVFLGIKIKAIFFEGTIKGKIDHLFGGLISGLKGIFIVTIFIAILSLIPNYIAPKQYFFSYAFNNSKFFPIIYKYNPFTFVSIYHFFQQINKDSTIIDHIEDKTLTKLFKNEDLQKAAANSDLLFFWNSPQIKEAIKNTELIKFIETFKNNETENN